jgi:hypothetical protein
VDVGETVEQILFIASRNHCGGTKLLQGPTTGSGKNNKASLGDGPRVRDWIRERDSPSVSKSVLSAIFSRPAFRSSPLREAIVGWSPSAKAGAPDEAARFLAQGWVAT